jgi:transposase-like protein
MVLCTYFGVDYSTNRGEENHNTKLTPEAVREIRELAGAGYGQREIGRMFGVSHKAVANILSGRTWSYVTD